VTEVTPKQAFQQAINRNPSNVAARGRAAIPLAFSGQLEGAIEVAEFALRLSPRDPRAYLWWLGLGLARGLIGEHDAAVRALQTCLLLRPNWAPAYRELTTNLAHLGRRREAVQAYEALLRSMPDALEREQDFAASVSEAVGEYGLGGLNKAAKWAAK
jgi:tetratricopeptide (TPR) repeat protein